MTTPIFFHSKKFSACFQNNNSDFNFRIIMCDFPHYVVKTSEKGSTKCEQVVQQKTGINILVKLLNIMCSITNSCYF